MTREQMIDRAVREGAYHTREEDGYDMWMLHHILSRKGAFGWVTPKYDVILSRIREEFRVIAKQPAA